MSYSSKIFLNWTSRWDAGSTADNGIFRHCPYISDSYFWDWDQYFSSVDAPAAGSALDTGDQAVYHVTQIAQMVTPFACRLTSISWAIDYSDPANNFETLKFVAVKGAFADEASRTATSATLFTVLGHATTTPTLTGNPTGRVQKGTAAFNSSNGDVAAGNAIGVGIMGGTDSDGGSGNISGVVTCTFETL